MVVGITDYAQDQLGDIVFLETAPAGRKIAAGESFGSVESVKSVSDLLLPVAGEVTQANADLVKKPETVNTDPYGKGWMVRIKPESPAALDGLMTPEQYRSHVTEETG